MDRLKKFESFEQINESRDVMINVIRNILKEIYQEDQNAELGSVIDHFADRLFINEEDKDIFYKSIVK